MAAPPPLSIRFGPDGIRDLDKIARRRGVSRADATRQAVAEKARRDRRRTGLAAEAQRLMADPEYVAEARDIAALMESLGGSR